MDFFFLCFSACQWVGLGSDSNEARTTGQVQTTKGQVQSNESPWEEKKKKKKSLFVSSLDEMERVGLALVLFVDAMVEARLGDGDWSRKCSGWLLRLLQLLATAHCSLQWRTMKASGAMVSGDGSA